ncbi:hypothetical protein [Microbacterium proteolyticum]|uniref:hypothetical protein n=1 Tax=Microbacterium proteolyticum TaxID=1572644 RepID=UPI0035C15307
MSNLFTRRHPLIVSFDGDGAGAPGGGNSGGENGGGDNAGGSSYTPPATQADLDRIVEARLARERDKFKGYDDLKAKAEKWDQLEDEKKTPSEKAIEEARAQAAGETSAKYERRIASTEIKSLAATVGFLDPADALAVLGDEVPKKDDEIDVDELKKRVEKLAADKPYLVKEASRKPRTRPTPRTGDQQQDDDTANQGGKGKAAAALRQLGKKR